MLKTISKAFKKSNKQLKIYIFVPIVIGLISSGLRGFSLMSFIDTVFLIAIFTLIFSSFMYLYEKGFFTVINYSFKRVIIVFSKSKLENYTNDKKVNLEDYLKTKKYPFTKPLLYASIILVVFTFILSITFYR